MKLIDGQLVLSPSDLTGYLACDHLAMQELAAARGEILRPERVDAELEILHRRGKEHEEQELAAMIADGGVVRDLTRESYTIAELEQAHADTLAAMQEGAHVIYQGTFFTPACNGNPGWRGHPDFLIRVDTSSALGAWSYYVADTKLARKVKPAAILQMCAYSEQLAQLQCLEPEHIEVILGSKTREKLRLRDFSAYFRSVKARFEELIAQPPPSGAPANPDSRGGPTYPNPVDHCRVCRWLDVCVEKRVADDHLSLVAGMRSSATRKLNAAGVRTLTDLAVTADNTPTVDGLSQRSFDTLRRQAALQLHQRNTGQHTYELLPPDPPRGLAALPEPQPGDLFFDMESDPWAGEGTDGLEYLFGILEGETYHAFWAHDSAAEKRAFEQAVDLMMDRLARNPGLHIYHYANYEERALKRLAGRHATREEEVDRLLRGGVLIDLYRVVKDGLRMSQDSYSLKKLEPLYMNGNGGRRAAVVDAGGSIVAYEQWLETREQQILDGIADYNREDCASTLHLRDWLEARRQEAMEKFGIPLPRPSPEDPEPEPGLKEAEQETADHVARLIDGVPELAAERGDVDNARWVLAGLLGWHRREARSQWWDYFRRKEMSDDELVDDTHAIGGLTYRGVVATIDKSEVHRYQFDTAQEHRIGIGEKPHDPRTGKEAGTVVGVDNVMGAIDLKRGNRSEAPHPTSLIPSTPIPSTEQRRAIARVAETEVGGGQYRAIHDLLLRRPSRVAGHIDGTPLALEGEAPLDAARRLALKLDASCLPVQGPPGTGKTWTGARMIVALIRTNRRVGITAVSHKAIGKLLDEVMKVAAEESVRVRAIQKATEEQRCASKEVESTESNDVVAGRLALGDVDLVAGTPWLFARAALDGQLDAVFVDEAGQMSLADVVAVGTSARNLVLLGDPQQLAQPSQGVHPAGSEVSALEHILNGHATIAPERGLFLGTSYRMHPDVCEFISEIAYEGRLHSAPECAGQRVLGDGLLSGSGLRYLPVEHQGNRTWSPEEIEVVDREFRALLGRTWVNQEGEERPITVEDILVVAPYNAHVARLAERLPEGARVGTVDKFQGQEAPVVFYSMATSSPDDMPRGMGFLYSINRLNVAVSRARGLAVLVCSPALLQVKCRTVTQMRVVAALLKSSTVIP